MFLRNLEFLDYEIDEETLQLITILEKKCALIFNKLKVNNSNEIFYSSIQQTPNEVFDYIEKLEIND